MEDQNQSVILGRVSTSTVKVEIQKWTFTFSMPCRQLCASYINYQYDGMEAEETHGQCAF